MAIRSTTVQDGPRALWQRPHTLPPPPPPNRGKQRNEWGGGPDVPTLVEVGPAPPSPSRAGLVLPTTCPSCCLLCPVGGVPWVGGRVPAHSARPTPRYVMLTWDWLRTRTERVLGLTRRSSSVPFLPTRKGGGAQPAAPSRPLCKSPDGVEFEEWLRNAGVEKKLAGGLGSLAIVPKVWDHTPPPSAPGGWVSSTSGKEGPGGGGGR